MLRLGCRACAQLCQCRRVAEHFLCLFAQALRQLLAAHHHQGSLQVFGDTRLVAAPLYETGLQSSQVCRNREADVLVIAELRGQFVCLESEKLGKQRPTLFQVTDQHVVDVDQCRATTGFELFGRAPRCQAILGVAPPKVFATQFVQQAEQPGVAWLMAVRRVKSCLVGRSFQSLHEQFLLARSVADDQGIDAMVPACDLPVELTGGQIGVIPQVQRSVAITAMAQHQQVRPIGFAGSQGNRCCMVERQDFPVINHQDLNPWIVVEKQCAVGAMDVFQRRRIAAVQTQGRYPQLERRRRAAGDRQLGGTQQRQGVATVTGARLDRQHLVIAYALHASGCNSQALHQQLQCRAFGSGKETHQSLQYLLIDVVHRLVMDVGHLNLPDAYKLDIAQTTARTAQGMA
ncbi:hypothetical protein D3C86_1088300 [compost metagenome]